MAGNTDFNHPRFSVRMPVPGSAAFLEAFARGSRALCEFAQNATHDHNKELCEYLDGFRFRIESERHEGRLVSEEWMLQLQSLFDRISACVIESERKSQLATFFGASEEIAQVDRFREEIKNLQTTMMFSDS
jgi:hypothetical protein